MFNKTAAKNPTFRHLTNSRGMTLVEIMIVLAIIGGLIAILAPRLTGSLDKAKVREAKIHMGQIMQALSMYYTDCGKYPSAMSGLVTSPGGECPNWGPEAYMKKEPKDPWGSDYVYSADGANYTLKSLGSDRKEGGSEFAADVSSENL